MGWTYILECADGSLYVGSTVDLERRVGEHDAGVGAAYTRRRRPVRLVWSAQYASIEEAFRYEKQIQGGAARSARRSSGASSSCCRSWRAVRVAGE